MTPFAALLTELMHARRLRAQAIASMGGVSAGYVSALLTGRKPPPGEVAKRIADGLELKEGEHQALLRAAAASRRRIEIPRGAHRDLFEAVHEIVDRADRLQPEQLQAIKLIAQLATDERKEETPGRKLKP